MIKVDLHAGCYPRPYLEELTKIGIGGEGGIGIEIPVWTTAEEAVAEMDEQAISMRVLHLSAPNVYFRDQGLSRALAVMTNDFISGIARQHPDRFLAIASIPLGSLDDAFRELDRALNTLGMCGVLLGTNVNLTALSDDRFLPFFEELDRRRVPVVLHPVRAIGQDLMPKEDAELTIPSNVGFLFEVTRVMAELTFKGIFERLPHLTFVLPHLGGTIPFVHPRWDMAYRTRPAGHRLRRLPQPPSYYLTRNCYYDTALSYKASTLRCTVDFAGVDRLVFGTDWPYTRDARYPAMVEALGGYGFTEEELEQIYWKNAARIFPDLAARVEGRAAVPAGRGGVE